ncbi:MAG: universal stress protein [Chloroflexi bacterium]|nr:universal stress protein [Chloroflexota bacterium]
MLNKILIGVDGSKQSEKALDYAVGLAKMCGGEIVMVSVAPLPIINMLAYNPSMITPQLMPEQVEKALEDQGNDILDKLVEKYKDSGVKITPRMEIGHPGPVICGIADEIKPDLVVVGSRGLGELKGLLLGSVSNFIVHTCKDPILLVK